MMQVSKRIPLDNPDVLNIVRGVYLLSNLVIAAIMYYVHTKINSKKGTSTMCRPPQPQARGCGPGAWNL
jgi:hypothetical protein